MDNFISATFTPITSTPEKGEQPDPEKDEPVTIVAFDMEGFPIFVGMNGRLARGRLSQFTNCKFVTF